MFSDSMIIPFIVFLHWVQLRLTKIIDVSFRFVMDHIEKMSKTGEAFPECISMFPSSP